MPPCESGFFHLAKCHGGPFVSCVSVWCNASQFAYPFAGGGTLGLFPVFGDYYKHLCVGHGFFAWGTAWAGLHSGCCVKKGTG